MDTTTKKKLEEIEQEGLILQKIGQEAAQIARIKNEIYKDLLRQKKASISVS